MFLISFKYKNTINLPTINRKENSNPASSMEIHLGIWVLFLKVFGTFIALKHYIDIRNRFYTFQRIHSRVFVLKGLNLDWALWNYFTFYWMRKKKPCEYSLYCNKQHKDQRVGVINPSKKIKDINDLFYDTYFVLIYFYPIFNNSFIIKFRLSRNVKRIDVWFILFQGL